MDTQVFNGLMVVFLGLLFTAVVVLDGVRNIILYLLIVPLLIAAPGIFATWRILLITRIVAEGTEASAGVSGHKVVHGPWRESRIIRVRLSYEFQGRRFERSASLRSPERTPLKDGARVTLLIDSKNPRRFVMRDLFVDTSADRSGQASNKQAFPLDGDSLWPKSKLLQLDIAIFKKRTIVILTKERLTIAEEEEVDDDSEALASNEAAMNMGYEFYDGRLLGESSYPALGIVKVALSPSILHTPIAIWVADDSGKASKVFKADAMGIPRSFMGIAKEAAKQGVLTEVTEWWDDRKIAFFAREILAKELERQFRRAAPQVEIEFRGGHLSDYDFRRLIR